MPTGIVIKFNNGYGFIAIDGSDQEVFAHQNDILMDGFRILHPGDKVEFETEQNDKGLKAINIKVLVKQRQPPSRNHSKNGRNRNDDLNKKFERLVEVLSDESNPEGSIISRSEADYILNGNRALTY